MNFQGTTDMLLRGVQAPHLCTRHMLLGTPLRYFKHLTITTMMNDDVGDDIGDDDKDDPHLCTCHMLLAWHPS